MISLIIPPKDQIARVNKMLSEEYGTAANIKSRVNRLSVLSAITSTQQRLKLYNKVLLFFFVLRLFKSSTFDEDYRIVHHQLMHLLGTTQRPRYLLWYYHNRGW
jgi:hypothetical protein